MPQGDSILDSFFQQGATAHGFSEADQAGASVLNSLFENASAQIEKAEEKDGVQGASVNIDELFGGMSTTSSEDKFEEAPEAPEAPGGDAIGESIGTIQLDHRTSAEQARKDTMLEPALEPEPADHAPPADRTAEPSVALLNDTRAEERLPRFLEPLSRREFVQHLMTLLHVRTLLCCVTCADWTGIYRPTRSTSTSCTRGILPSTTKSS